MRRLFLFRSLLPLAVLSVLSLLQTGCLPSCQKMEPHITCQLSAYRISELPSAFPLLSEAERKEEWAKELIIGDAFAKECDFYRAITAYHRALILLEGKESKRDLQLHYNLLLCYYLGAKYQEAINIFESCKLSQVGPEFPAFRNLLLIVYDAYFHTAQEDKASQVLKIIEKYSPDSSLDLHLYQSLKEGQVDEARCQILAHPQREALLADFAYYEQFAKSPKKAALLNAVLPGAGYYYVGQRRSALTSFVINALFTAAAYQFFRNGYPAAGAIVTSIEAGWYLGGINGASIEAQEFNTRLFEGVGRKILTDEQAFPILMFDSTF